MLDLAAAFEAHNEGLVRYCISRVGPDAAEDVASQVWLEAVRRAEAYEDRGWPVSTWLITIARSRCADHFRHEQRRPTAELHDRIRAARDLSDEVAERVDAYTTLRAVLAAMTPREACALIFAAEGWMALEIAAAWGCSTNAVKAAIHRGRERARAMKELDA